MTPGHWRARSFAVFLALVVPLAPATGSYGSRTHSAIHTGASARLIDAVVAGGAAPPPAGRAQTRDVELQRILERASAYVADFFNNFSAAVAEEEYVQTIGSGGTIGANRRVLHSDLLLVRRPDNGDLMPFRDVFDVDGTPVRDRQDRLQKLFLEKPGTAFDDARRIAEESARYNLGSINRTVNVPVLALQFLERRYLPRFEFKKRRQEVIDGLPVWRVDYLEKARPTLIRTTTGADAKDMPAEGSFWIDAATGRVVRTRLKVTRNVDAEIVVRYRANEILGFWVPAEMKETYAYRTRQINATATYSNFRRFQVLTDEKVKVPK